MRSVLVALRVLEAISEHQPVGVSALARVLGLSKTTVQRSLSTLADAGWIELHGKGKGLWNLALRSLVVGGRAIEARRAFRSVALASLDALRRATEETVHLFLWTDGQLVLVERLDGIKPVQVFNPLGVVAPLHRTSCGRAVLAHLPAQDVSALLRQPLTYGNPRRPLDPQAFLEELQAIRRRGYAINIGENQPGVAAVGAAVIGQDARPVAAVTISGTTERLTSEVIGSYGAMIARAADRIAMAVNLSKGRQGSSEIVD